jgi:hypothetical protein
MTNLTTVKRKKFSTETIVASLLVTAAILSVSAVPVHAAAPPTPDIGWYGSPTSPDFTISKDAQLAGLAQLVNAGSDDFKGKKITIDRNIDLSKFTNWTPIGDSSKPFNGTFNGGGKTVSKLSITSAVSSAGLFGQIGGGGAVQNLNLKNVSIMGGASDSGGVAGINKGAVKNCTVSGTVTGGNGFNAGGVAGKNDVNASIENCSVMPGSSITGTKGRVGALAGENVKGATIKNNTGYKSVKVNGAPVSKNNLVGSGDIPTNTRIANPLAHGGSGGGCDAGFGFAGFAALAGAGLICHRKKQ